MIISGGARSGKTTLLYVKSDSIPKTACIVTIEDEKILGELSPTGIRPLIFERPQAAGFKMGAEMFGGSL